MIHTRNITALILLCILSTFCSLGATGKNFVHPGLLHSREAIERTRGWVQHRNEVAMGSYEKLLRDAKAQSSYRMAGQLLRLSHAMANTVAPSLPARTTFWQHTTMPSCS